MSSVGVVLKSVFGSKNDRTIKALLPLVSRVNALEPATEALSDAQLSAKTAEFRKRLAAGETLDDLLPEAFAACREASKRTLGLRHFDVQLIGGAVLHRGMIAEMVTGEGKTLVATLSVYLNALGGTVHVVTVNDYLARRDAEWMRPVYEALGMTVGAIQAPMHSRERIPIYHGDIVYGTNSEFGFDYLRDNMKVAVDDQCQKALRYAVIDEVDSILIDEARTPLIISGPAEEERGLYEEADRIARKLKPGEDFEVKEKEHQCILSDEGMEKAERLAGVSFFEGGVTDWPHLIETALRAHHIYKLDTDYVVLEGEIIIVDEFTGRLMQGRRWSDGLHQAVEAKEGIRVREENQTLATITYQNFFKLYKKLGGMTGTALTEASEFWSIYKLDVVSIPTNRPLVRVSGDDRVYRTEKEKFGAVVEEIVAVHESGRPILVGTTSIEKSERVSGMLQRRGIEHQVLNAKQHEREALIVAEAGQRGKVTIATNMAGRGTDIILGPGHRRRRRPPHHRDRAARVAPHRQPAARARGPSGRPGLVAVLPLARRRPDAEVRARVGGEVPLEARAGRGRGHHPPDGHQGHHARAEEGRGLQLRDPQEPPRVRRGHGHPAQGGLRPAPVRPRGRREAPEGRRRAHDPAHDRGPRRTSGSDARSPSSSATRRSWASGSAGTSRWTSPDAEVPSAPSDAVTRLTRTALERWARREQEIGVEDVRRLERFLLLNSIDAKWKDHLRAMDGLKTGINLRGYGQMDPKVEYKVEGHRMFSEMLRGIREEVTDLLFKVRLRTEEEAHLADRWGGADDAPAVPPPPPPPLPRAQAPRAAPPSPNGGRLPPPGAPRPPPSAAQPPSAFRDARSGAPVGSNAGPTAPIRRDVPKVGRNEPCPCGSGKKYKKCHGQDDLD